MCRVVSHVLKTVGASKSGGVASQSRHGLIMNLNDVNPEERP